MKPSIRKFPNRATPAGVVAACVTGALIAWALVYVMSS